MAFQVRRIYTSTGKNCRGPGAAKPELFDVVALMTNGDKYVASFLTYTGIPALQQRHQTSGEYLAGVYFWTKNMILVADCRPETIRLIIEHLLEEGEFQEVFEKI